MPRWYYVYPMHLGARLSDADKVLLKSWLMKDGARRRPPSSKKPEP
jgi:hypothetical protein